MISLEKVVEQYQAALLRYATRVLKNADAAQDVVQEAFVRLHKNWDKVKSRYGTPKGWLYRTVHNAAVDYIRGEERRKLLHWRQSEEIKTVTDSDNNGMSEKKTLVLQHLDSLKPKEREVLVLRLQEGMSYKEIATVIGRSDGYVGTLIHSATKKLTQSLKQAGVVS